MSDERGKINLGDYSDYVRIVFNSRIDKWELNMLEEGKHVLRKHFFDKSEAEMQAIHYLGQIGVLNSGNLSKEKEFKGKREKHNIPPQRNILQRCKKHVGSQGQGIQRLQTAWIL